VFSIQFEFSIFLNWDWNW